MNKLMQFFKFDHLPPDLKVVSIKCYELAASIDSLLPESTEKTAGLRKLLEAKYCFVRAMLEQQQESPGKQQLPDKSEVQQAAERGFRS